MIVANNAPMKRTIHFLAVAIVIFTFAGCGKQIKQTRVTGMLMNAATESPMPDEIVQVVQKIPYPFVATYVDAAITTTDASGSFEMSFHARRKDSRRYYASFRGNAEAGSWDESYRYLDPIGYGPSNEPLSKKEDQVVNITVVPLATLEVTTLDVGPTSGPVTQITIAGRCCGVGSGECSGTDAMEIYVNDIRDIPAGIDLELTWVSDSIVYTQIIQPTHREDLVLVLEY